MRMIILPATALALIGATNGDEPAMPAPDATESIVMPLDNPTYFRTTAQAKLIERAQSEAPPSEAQCRDRITRARKEAGKPPLLDREPASPDKPYHIYAVDRRQDGCAVMVMKGDVQDIRPLPAPAEEPLRIIPADAADADE